MDDSRVQEVILSLLHEGENPCVEFKEGGLEAIEFGKYISALSNSATYFDRHAAFLLLGVHDGSRTVVGTNFDYVHAGPSGQLLEPWLRGQLSDNADFAVYETSFEGSRVVLFQIFPARGFPLKFQNIAYMRVDSALQMLSKHPSIEARLWDKVRSYIFELQPASDTVYSEDGVHLVLDLQAYIELSNLSDSSDRSELFPALLESRILIPVQAGFQISNLGALTLAQNLHEFPSLLSKRLRITRYRGLSRLNALAERRFDGGYASVYREAIRFTQENAEMREAIRGALREEMSYPEVCIREFLANALIHQDLAARGEGPVVEMYDDRVHFLNPGSPLVPTTRFIDSHGKTRNEHLAEVMRVLNICDLRGSGVLRSLEAVWAQGLPPPAFQSVSGYTKAVLFNYKPLSAYTKADRIRACYHHCVMQYMASSFMTNSSLRSALGLPKKQTQSVTGIINDTKSEGLIRRHDEDSTAKRTAKYVPFFVSDDF